MTLGAKPVPKRMRMMSGAAMPRASAAARLTANTVRLTWPVVRSVSSVSPAATLGASTVDAAVDTYQIVSARLTATA